MTETDVLNYFTHTGPVLPPGLKDSTIMQFHLYFSYTQNWHSKHKEIKTQK